MWSINLIAAEREQIYTQVGNVAIFRENNRSNKTSQDDKICVSTNLGSVV